MTKRIFYEWDIETLALNGTDDPDILDHSHSDKCPGVPAGPRGRLVLVRDDRGYYGDDLDRSWAYVSLYGHLPDYFEDANGQPVAKVPQRFHYELAQRIAADEKNGEQK